MGMYILTVEDEEKPEQLAERKLLHGGYQISKNGTTALDMAELELYKKRNKVPHFFPDQGIEMRRFIKYWSFLQFQNDSLIIL